MTEEEDRVALTMHPYAFVHAGFSMDLPSPKILHEIKKSDVYVVTTLAIYKMMLLMWNEKELNDPWLRKLVPESQLKTALNFKSRSWVIDQVVVQSRPNWAPEFLARLFSKLFFNQSIAEKQLQNALISVKKMYETGIPLVMGSDSGNWPVWTTYFHGVGSVLEMEALEEAGIPNDKIITMATARAAKMLKIENEVGSIESGKIADLLLLNKNPLESMKAFRDVKLVIKGGVGKTPQEWLSSN